jgi:hypothetical protein
MTDPSLRIVKLNGSNYQTWKFKVELLLIKDDLWEVVNEAPPDEVTAEWSAKDRKARATIGLLIEDSQLNLIRKENTARSTWNALKQYHEKSTLSNKVSLLKRLCALRLAEGGDMEKHLTLLEDLIEQLTSLGETIAEPLTVALFPSSLPDSFGTLKTALETRPETDLTMELVKSKLIDEYKRRNESPVSTDQGQQALKTTQHNGGKPYETARQKQNSTVCFFCKKPNHMKKECRKYIEWKKKNPDHKAKAVRHSKGATNQDLSDEDACFYVGENNATNVWYIDSGATSHMCSNRDFFCEFDEKQCGQIVIAGGQKLRSSGIGTGYIRHKLDGQIKAIKVTDVLFVPEQKGNLISVRKLTDKGLKAILRKNLAK